MKVCCETGQQFDKMTSLQRIGCQSTDHCTGIKDVSDGEYALIELVRLGQEMGLYEESK